jgi:uncharacterized protein (DUF924 family)
MTMPQDVLSFWLDEVGSDGWYTQDDALDRTIQDRFGPVYESAMDGRYGLWLTYPSGVLAYLIVLDQFSRNMFRNSAQAFEADAIALAVAKQAIERNWDLKIDPPARQFFYLPLMHAENLCDQDRCVRLMKDRLSEQPDSLLHARAHREVIRRFGRFPYRNAALGRSNSEAEEAFLNEGGYGAVLRAMQQKEPVAA